MTSDPDQIREQIEETRISLSEDVNTLADTVNPAHAAKRKAASARSAVLGVKDKVMGAASQSVSSTTSAAGEKASAVQEKASAAPDRLRRQAAGNPLAVGLIAVGVGWLRRLASAGQQRRGACGDEGQRNRRASRHRRGQGRRGQPPGPSKAGSRVGQGRSGRRRRRRQGRDRQLGARRPGSGTGSPRHRNRQPPLTTLAATPGLSWRTALAPRSCSGLIRSSESLPCPGNRNPAATPTSKRG